MGRRYIKRLTMGGFQVFAEPVTVPLGPLTLVYGPNSAGKSAILDALMALADLCELRASTKSTAASKNHRISEILGRHWRRENVTPAARAEALQLGAMIRISGEDWAKTGFADHKGEFGFGTLSPKGPRFEKCFPALRSLIEAEYVDVEIIFRYQLAEEALRSVAHTSFAQEHRIEVKLCGSPILQFCEASQWAAINLDHEALVAWNAAADLKSLARRFGNTFVLQDGWFVLEHSYLSHGGLDTNAVDNVSELLSRETDYAARSATDSFINMFDALFSACLGSMTEVLRVALVPASRTVPDRSEVTFLFTADGTVLPSETIGLHVKGSPQHLAITRSAFLYELERSGQSEPTEALPSDRPPRLAKDPIDLVNRLLGDYLFRTSGYFVSAGIHQLTPLGLASTEYTRSRVRDTRQKFLACLELRDTAGRRFHFDEVGSGLGYVLPVLLSVVTFDKVFLQQPELHLHPALQSELADALIAVLGDADFGGGDSRGCSQIIAETHSEHLLLRLLRRVRQAANMDRSIDPHSLGREDLIVLYVDPNPDGSSTVKHLRIARDGEFIDRWPQGFFEERWAELFDE